MYVLLHSWTCFEFSIVVPPTHLVLYKISSCFTSLVLSAMDLTVILVSLAITVPPHSAPPSRAQRAAMLMKLVQLAARLVMQDIPV